MVFFFETKLVPYVMLEKTGFDSFTMANLLKCLHPFPVDFSTMLNLVGLFQIGRKIGEVSLHHVYQFPWELRLKNVW